jgi:hypothetical protein
MKYLKKFELFLEEVEEKEEGTDDIEQSPVTSPGVDQKTKDLTISKLKKKSQELIEFKQKFNMIDNVFKDPKVHTDAELDAKLLPIYKNKKLAAERSKTINDYVSVLRSIRRKEKLKKTIDRDTQEIENLKKDTSENIKLKNMQLQDSTSEEQSKIKKEISDLQDKLSKDIQQLRNNISKNNEILKKDIINWQKKKEDYKKDVKIEEERLKSLMSNLQK